MLCPQVGKTTYELLKEKKPNVSHLGTLAASALSITMVKITLKCLILGTMKVSLWAPFDIAEPKKYTTWKP